MQVKKKKKKRKRIHNLLAGGAKLAAVRLERAKLLVKLERFAEACVALVELEDSDDLVELRCEAMQGRQQALEREAVKAMALASGLNAKQQAAKEAEIHAMSVLPADLRLMFDRGASSSAMLQCRYIGALFESIDCQKYSSRLMQLISEAIARMEANPHPEDWKGKETKRESNFIDHVG